MGGSPLHVRAAGIVADRSGYELQSLQAFTTVAGAMISVLERPQLRFGNRVITFFRSGLVVAPIPEEFWP